MDLRDQLTEEIDTAEWIDLLPHFTHNRILLCGEGLGLLEAAVAIAEDESGVVGTWLQAGSLSRPTDDHAAAWQSDGASFRFLIIQPFVLIKRAATAEA